MSQSPALRTFQVDRAVVEVYPSKSEAGKAAALRASAILKAAISKDGRARLILATGNSQEDLVAALVQVRDLDWSRLEVFHMDEYVNLPETDRGCLKRWFNSHFVEVVHPSIVRYLDGNAPDLDAECRRYERLLRAAPITLCQLGIGENGHIAFNDPHVADFADPLNIKRVTLDERCRRQQAGEGHFANFESVPAEALTLTCPMLMSSENLICCVPEGRKAEAVRNAIEGPVTTRCPGSVVRTHPHASIYLDADSASLLNT
ncbi:MAG: glucosamine-6-phosphate deaminase [Terriglobia bacterium]